MTSKLRSFRDTVSAKPTLVSKRDKSIFIVAGLLGLLLSTGRSAFAQLTVTGVIRAEEEVIIRSEFSGIVARIAVNEGDRVLEGQLLVELRNERQKINLDLARAGLTKADASLKETQSILENAEKELNRVKIAESALPRKELEDKQDQVSRIKANLEVQAASVAQAKEEIRLRENELNETRLTAPFKGTVTQIFINRGDTLRPLETQVMELVALEPLFAEMLLPSSYIDKVRRDQRVKVQVESDSTPLGEVAGKVVYVNPKVDAASRTFKVKIEIINTNGKARPGMLAQVRFEP